MKDIFTGNNPMKKQCSVVGCENQYKAKGLCNKHYIRKQKYGDPLIGLRYKKSLTGICEIKKCKNKHVGKGLCSHHYYKLKKYGDPLFKKEPKQIRLCSVKGCQQIHKAQNFCFKHYQRLRRYKIKSRES